MFDRLKIAVMFLIDGNLKVEPKVNLQIADKVVLILFCILIAPIAAILGLIKTIILLFKLMKT